MSRCHRESIRIVCAVTLACFATPLFAQDASPLGALKAMAGGLSKRPAAVESAVRSPAQSKSALKGKWQASLKDCYQPSDSFVFADSNSWSGYEWACEVPDTAYNSQGFAGNLACAAEGEDYRAKMRVVLANDGQSLTVFKLDEGTSERLVKCPKETEEIAF